MPDVWVAFVLGVVEGLTEFLPVSSTGHLVLVGHALGFTGEFADAFEVAIQPGALLAVVVLYRRRFAALLRPAEPGRFGGARGLWLLALATVPVLAVGFAIRGVHHVLMTPVSVALALAAGAVGILWLEARRGDRGTAEVDALSPRAALGIGVFQCLALWPGISRSAATIGGGMVLGLRRGAAAEFSFLAAVPALLAASLYKVWQVRALLTADHALVLAVGFVSSAVAAAFAVKGFVALLRRTDMKPFAWYRLALAAVVLAVLA